jgi:hypothetical protein
MKDHFLVFLFQLFFRKFPVLSWEYNNITREILRQKHKMSANRYCSEHQSPQNLWIILLQNVSEYELEASEEAITNNLGILMDRGTVESHHEKYQIKDNWATIANTSY